VTELFRALTLQEARDLLAKHLSTSEKIEKIPLTESLGRLLAADVYAVDDVPGFHRSTMDGFAVQAKDTYGASESMPAYLSIAGDVIMGSAPAGRVQPGQAWRIATGGMLPEGADSIVMVEYTEELAPDSVLIHRAVAPGENVIRKGEDLAAGSLLLSQGRRIRPQDMGILSATGITVVEVYPRCRVGIISTGDELVEPWHTPLPGQVRDINSYALSGAVEQCGGEPKYYGIVKDEQDQLTATLVQALEENHIVILSGGSSVGSRDVAAASITSLGQPGVLFHGLSIKPGKPAIGAVIENKPVLGLPGHPASAMMVFDLMVAPLIRYGRYEDPEQHLATEYQLTAELIRNQPSAAGREDFVRVKLFWKDGRLYADPVLGKSGLINTLVKADGLAYIPAGKEGITAGELVRVKRF